MLSEEGPVSCSLVTGDLFLDSVKAAKSLLILARIPSMAIALARSSELISVSSSGILSLVLKVPDVQMTFEGIPS